MPQFKYRVRDRYGKPLEGNIDAKDKTEVVDHLKGMGYIPVSIEEKRRVFKTEFFLKKFFEIFKYVTSEDLNVFTRQFCTLQTAGVPILSSLEALKEQTQNRFFKGVIIQLMKYIESGLSLSEAISRHPKVFSELYVSMIAAGEASGTLGEILDRLAVLGEHEQDTRSKIKVATRYPLLVVITICAAFLVVVTFVFPKFAALFGQFKVALPLPTRILILISNFIKNFWLVSIIFILVFIFGIRWYINTKQGRIIWDAIKLKIPVFGPLISKIIMSRFARVTGILTRSGLPMLQTLDMLSRTVGNVVIARAIENIRISINEGKGMAEPMRVSKVFSPIVVHMVAIGEETGKIDELLLRVSDYYDAQVDYTTRNLTTLIEPILLFALGGIVLLMALAIFLPMWNMIGLFRR